MWAIVTTGVAQSSGAAACSGERSRQACDDSGRMSWLDVVLVAMLALSLYSGYRRGAVLQVIGIVGLAVGVLVGVALAPRVAQARRIAGHGGRARARHRAGVGSVGNMLGYAVGSRVRRRAHETPIRSIDALVGAMVSAVALLLATVVPCPEPRRGSVPGGVEGAAPLGHRSHARLGAAAASVAHR